MVQMALVVSCPLCLSCRRVRFYASGGHLRHNPKSRGNMDREKPGSMNREWTKWQDERNGSLQKSATLIHTPHSKPLLTARIERTPPFCSNSQIKPGLLVGFISVKGSVYRCLYRKEGRKAPCLQVLEGRRFSMWEVRSSG